MIPERLARLRKEFLSRSFDADLITGESNIRYMTGALGGGILFVDSDKAVLFSPPVNFNKAADSVCGAVECRNYEGVWPTKEITDLTGGRRVCFETCGVTYETSLRLLALEAEPDDTVSRLRMIKEPGEIELIRGACRRASDILGAIDPFKWLGRTEAELAGYLENQAWLDGFSGGAFSPIVASGANSAYPHHTPADEVISSGWLKIDYGIVRDGYCSDLTRTYILTKFVNNFNSQKLLKHLENSKNAAARKLKPGAICGEIYDEARKVLKEYGLDRYFTHGLGHGVGLEIHEKPWLRAGENTVLKESMVVTVEPGFYIRGAGGMRLEDTYLITSEGSESLTSQFQ